MANPLCLLPVLILVPRCKRLHASLSGVKLPCSLTDPAAPRKLTFLGRETHSLSTVQQLIVPLYGERGGGERGDEELNIRSVMGKDERVRKQLT